jgi:hypothetical protein
LADAAADSGLDAAAAGRYKEALEIHVREE